MFENLTNDTNYNDYIIQDELNQFAPTCEVCEYSLTSLNTETLIHYDGETLTNLTFFEPPFKVIDYDNIDLLTKLDEAYNNVKFRSFEKVEIFNVEELNILS